MKYLLKISVTCMIAWGIVGCTTSTGWRDEMTTPTYSYSHDEAHYDTYAYPNSTYLVERPYVYYYSNSYPNTDNYSWGYPYGYYPVSSFRLTTWDIPHLNKYYRWHQHGRFIHNQRYHH